MPPAWDPAIASSLVQLLTWAPRRQAAPTFTLRASLRPLAAPHPPRCSDLANRARRCRSRSRSPPTGAPSPVNPFPLGVDFSPSPDLSSLRFSGPRRGPRSPPSDVEITSAASLQRGSQSLGRLLGWRAHFLCISRPISL